MGKKPNKVVGVTVTVVILIASAATLLVIFKDNLFFSAGGRYDDSKLDYMDVIYANQSDIYAFNEGYSETDACPWGFVHNGIDYFFNNDSAVIAAAPGKVTGIVSRDYGASVENRYHARIIIRFNKSTEIVYNFEMWTNNSADLDHQLALFNVTLGQWVEKGQRIATFLNINSGAHIHFGVEEHYGESCPQKYFSTDGYTEIMSLIHSYHPTWDLCYV
ncbi:MAG: M23 family metallopeptidase [Promethearchaeota archaeon]